MPFFKPIYHACSISIRIIGMVSETDPFCFKELNEHQLVDAFWVCTKSQKFFFSHKGCLSVIDCEFTENLHRTDDVFLQCL